MDNFEIIATWKQEQFEELLFSIRKAIVEVDKQNLKEGGIRILIPHYVVELLSKIHHFDLHNPIASENGRLYIYGHEIHPSYENFVIVYHIDMPMQGSTCYQTIDLM